MRLLIVALLLTLLWPAIASADACPPAEEAWAILDQIGGSERYELRHGCITVTGVSAGQVMEVSDGEFHTFVVVDQEWQATFAPDVPSDEPVIIDTELHTDGNFDKLPIRWVGQRVAITGALVYDRLRGYGRINPVWVIE